MRAGRRVGGAVEWVLTCRSLPHPWAAAHGVRLRCPIDATSVPAPSLPPLPPFSAQAALPADVFQGFVSALKPKQQQRLQAVLGA